MNNQVLIDRERELFEQAMNGRAARNGRIYETYYFKRSSKDGHYLNSSAQMAWEVWGEARALLQSPAPKGVEPTVVAHLMRNDYYETYVHLNRDNSADVVEPLMTIAQHRAIVAGLAGKVPSVQITGHLDEIDAPIWQFINSEAIKLGPQTGSIDNYNFSRPNGSQPNGGVTALWNGNKLHALAVTVRDTHNRTVCVRLLATPLPPSPKEGGL